jgi:Lon protease-like protein
MSDSAPWLPLFPLNAVLFPGGTLPLRVFEARYIDMMRECLREKKPFGIVLIKSGKEVGVAAEPETVGCLAHIDHVDMISTGILAVDVRGGERFRIFDTRELDDHRLEAQVEMIKADDAAPINDVHMRCAKALKTVIDNLNAKAASEDGNGIAPKFVKLHFEDTAWVANRWCELLPIPLKARQKLLELDSAKSRLEIVYRYLQQHAIL